MEDRMSSLPDDLLHTIMSSLTARQAVQTCVLSRRWLGLWCSMPCLNIDQQEFFAADDPDARSYRSSPKTPGDARFLNFVDNLLTLHKAPLLYTFRVNVTNACGRGVVDRCARFGIKGCPQVLELASVMTYELPSLGSSSCCLRRLRLVGVYLNKDFTLHLRSGCPVLEDLELEGCLIAYPKIISSSLKNLVLTDCSTHWGHVLTVTAPALVSFHTEIIPVGYYWKGIVVDEMPSITKASICFKYHPCAVRGPHQGPFNLLSRLSNVRDLELSGSETLWILHMGLDSFPTFPNLRTLLFNGCDMSDNFILECFLNNACSLEKLTLHYCNLAAVSREGETRKNLKMVCRTLYQHALSFECPNLRWTEIRYKERDADQLFGRLSGIWRNLQKSTITLTKVGV